MDGSFMLLFLVVSLTVAAPASTLRGRHANSRHLAINKRIARSLQRTFNFHNFHQLGATDNLKALGFNGATPKENEQLIIRKRRQDPGSTAENSNRQQHFLDTLSNQISTHIVDPVIEQLEHLHIDTKLKEISNGLETSEPEEVPSETDRDTQNKNAAPDDDMKEFGTNDPTSPKIDILPELTENSSEEEVEELNPTFVLPKEEGHKLQVVEDPIKDNMGIFSGDGSGSGDNGFIMEEGSGFFDTMFTFTEDAKDQIGDEEAQTMLGDNQEDWSPSSLMNELQEQLLSVKEQVGNDNKVESEMTVESLPNDNDVKEITSNKALDEENEFGNQLINLILKEEENDKLDEDEALRNFLLPFSMEYFMTSILKNEADQIRDGEYKEEEYNRPSTKDSQQANSVTDISSDLSEEEKKELVSDGLLMEEQREKQKQFKVLTTCTSVRGNEITILPEDLCDGTKDCINAEDENPARCEGNCSPGYSKCDDGLQCLKDNLFCNGIHQCHDRSDEYDCERSMADCEKYGMFSCDGVCRLKSFLCDHTSDCSDGIDEQGCSYEIFSCPDGFNFDDVKLQCVYHV